MSVVANVAINVDSSGAVSKLRQVQQGAQATSQAVDKLNATTAAAGAASAGAATQFQNAANGMRAQQNAAGSLLGSIGRLASAYLSLRVAQQAVQAGIKREESERRLTFLAQGYNEVARAQTLASQSGNRFGLSATESNQQFAQLYGRLRPLNTSIEDINAAFVGFNTAAKVSGTSTAETAGALLQLTQALGSGVLRGQELNSVLEQAPGLVVALTKELGVPVSTLRKLAEEGKITSDVVINALKRAGTEGAGQLEAALKGPAQSVKNLQNSFEDFQVALTNDVIPAVVELLKGITSILGAFNKLPGPVKTITAVVLGLAAAFVALAPALNAAIGLLGGLSLATLAAAAPWIALAAGIAAAGLAILDAANAQRDFNNVIATAPLPDVNAKIQELESKLRAAETKLADVTAQFGPLSREAAFAQASVDGLKGSLDLAKGDYKIRLLFESVGVKPDARFFGPGFAAPAAPTRATPLPSVGNSTGRTAGVDKAANEAKRKEEEAKRETKRVADVVRDQQFITKQKGIQTKFAQLIFEAEQAADPIRVRQLQTVEALVLAGNETARLLEAEEDGVARLAIARARQAEVEGIRQEGALDTLKLQAEQQKNFDAIIADLDLELKLKTATTEQEREQLRIAAERAKLEAQLKGLPQSQIDQATGLQAQVSAPLADVQKIDQYVGKLKDEIADLTSISNIAITSAEGIGNAFAQSFQGLISGTMTAKEALGSFFKSVADMFLEMAAQIIAKQITMIILQTILKALGATGGGGGGGGAAELGSNLNVAAYSGTGIGDIGIGTFPMRAMGGPTAGGMPYLVGERGPELFVPGSNGGVMSNNDLRSAMNSQGGGAAGSPVLNMSFESTTIGGVEYVSRDQLEQAMAETRRSASRDGAQRGMTMTLDRIQNSSSTRRRIGV